MPNPTGWIDPLGLIAMRAGGWGAKPPELIDGLLRLKEGGKRYEFVGADSSFILQFEKISKAFMCSMAKANMALFLCLNCWRRLIPALTLSSLTRVMCFPLEKQRMRISTQAGAH